MESSSTLPTLSKIRDVLRTGRSASGATGSADAKIEKAGAAGKSPSADEATAVRKSKVKHSHEALAHGRIR